MPSATYGFLGNPKALTIINTVTTYTIPAGEYAYVTAQVRGGGTVRLDSTTVLTSDSWNTLGKGAGNLWSTGTAGALNATASGTSTDAAYTADTAESSEAASYWVPTGTVVEITATPSQVVIQRFNE